MKKKFYNLGAYSFNSRAGYTFSRYFGLGPCFVMHYLSSFHHLDKEEKVDCFTLIFFLMSCD